ncbi:hypothetical protein DEU56DRAFT_388263 [Suillus clintonianus]|uniref:uncharacterized protein n=1 Tax=Suillus clintonianus TaxID=1904413 RepID=UPI001B8648CA|nr:uncharacterized protein DEU56DRAFT_388263 [Suillus clintonianus]KAG2135769.1 hypothetical protein DEU56DRAFT_388263 [Suillus clintonianus]
MFNGSTPYNVEIIQLWRGKIGPYRHFPLHWVIYVETDPGIGNTYQVVGNPDNYATDIKLNQPYEKSDNWRGSFSVGTVNWVQLGEMERIISRVQIMHDIPGWNSQDWVASALFSLKCSGFFGITSEVGVLELADKMCWLLEGWPGVENMVEFIGGDDLACVIANRHFKKTHKLVWRAPEYGHMREWLKESCRNTCHDFCGAL